MRCTAFTEAKAVGEWLGQMLWAMARSPSPVLSAVGSALAERNGRAERRLSAFFECAWESAGNGGARSAEAEPTV